MHRCEGEGTEETPGCLRWQSQAGETYDEKVTCCIGCPKNCTPPLRETPRHGESETQGFDRDVDELVAQVSYLVAFENAGQATDWDEYPFEIQKLYVFWREAETDIRQIRESRHASYIKALITGPQDPLAPPPGT